MRETLIVLACAVAGCIEVPPLPLDSGPFIEDVPDSDRGVTDTGSEACSDEDDDGYLPAGCASAFPADCDDLLVSIGPGARDVCGNSRDESCLNGDLPCNQQLLPLTAGSNAQGFHVFSTRGRSRFDPTHLHLVELISSGGSGMNLINTQIIETQDFRKIEAYAAVAYGSAYVSFRNDPASPSVPAIDENGSAIVQWSYDWTAYNMFNMRSGMHGTSRYTFHADGRIHRDEVVTVDEPLTNVAFSAFIGLSRERFSQLIFQLDGTRRSVPIRNSYSGEAYTFPWPGLPNDSGFVCAFDPAGRDVIVYTHHRSAPVVPEGLRITESGTVAINTNSFAFNSDWAFGPGAVATGVYRAQMLIYAGDMGHLPTPCVIGEDHARAFTQPPQLMVTTGTISIRPGDRLRDGFDETVGAYSVAPSDGTVEFTLSGFFPGSFTLHVDNAPNNRRPVITAGATTLEHGRDYHQQVGEDGLSWWIVFRAEIPFDTHVRLTWPL